MSKKSRKKKKKVVDLPATIYPAGVKTFCGFRLVPHRVNQLWDWKTLEDIKL